MKALVCRISCFPDITEQVAPGNLRSFDVLGLPTLFNGPAIIIEEKDVITILKGPKAVVLGAGDTLLSGVTDDLGTRFDHRFLAGVVDYDKSVRGEGVKENVVNAPSKELIAITSGDTDTDPHISPIEWAFLAVSLWISLWACFQSISS